MRRQQTLIIHKLLTNQMRTEIFDGKSYYVIPGTAVQEQVLNGQFAPAEEIGAFPEAWNDIPVPVGHPEINGMKVSSKSQQVLENQVIGRWYNSKFENNQLKGEFWVDIAKAQMLAKTNKEISAALTKIEKGEPMEVSTAYFCDVESSGGMYNNVAYTGVQHNIRPDHIALLPNEIGACSIADGCGTMKVNHITEGGEILNEIDQKNTWKAKVQNTLNKLTELFQTQTDDEDMEPVTNMTHRDLRDALRKKIKDDLGDTYYVWIVDVDTENWFVYEREEKQDSSGYKYFKQSFAFDSNGNITWVGDPIEVVKKTVYEPVKTEQNNPAINHNEGSENQMVDNSKKELITKINSYECNKFSANVLNEMDEDSLAIIEAGLAANCQEEEETGQNNIPATNSREENNQESTTEESESPTINADAVESILKDKLGMGFDELKANIERANQAENDKKNKIIEALAANKACDFTKDELEGFQLNHLEKLARAYKSAVYLGAGGPAANEFENNAEDGVPEYGGVLMANEETEVK